MPTRHFLNLVLVVCATLAMGCGDTADVNNANNDNQTDPEPLTCEPRPEEELQDCSIEVGELIGETRYIRTREELQAVCKSTCSRFEGGLVLEGLPGVTNLSALQNVRELDSLAVAETDDLTSLEGLENLAFTSSDGQFGGVVFRRNTSLETLEGLNFPSKLDSSQAPTSIPPQFRIVANSSLRSLDGLEQIEETRNVDWQISDNASLQNVDGLRNLKTATRVGMTFERNPVLESVELDSLTDPTGVSIEYNDRLTRLYLPSLETAEVLIVTNNESLPACQVDQIAAQADIEKVENIANDDAASCE